MISGSGVTHSERFDHARVHGATMHGIQAWVALPDEAEEADPAFFHHAAHDLPQWTEPGFVGQLIAGEAEGMRSPVEVHSPQFYMDWQMEAGARRILPADYSERAIYCAVGSLDLSGCKLAAGQMAVLTHGQELTVTADVASRAMVLGGEPIGERFMLWNFVSSSKDRLLQAKEDWKQGRMKLPDIDNAEFIPFPEERKIEP